MQKSGFFPLWVKGGGGLSKKNEKELVLDGLEKLAFGKVNDAVRLVFAEEVPSAAVLARMNLFNVASISRDKGGVEVKFFDRQRALERLYDYANAGQNGETAESLLRALTGGDGNED